MRGCGGSCFLRRMKRISGDEGDGSRDQAWASEHAKEGTERAKEGTERAKEGMIWRISTWDRPKLISRPKGGLGLPVAGTSFRNCDRCTSLSAGTTLSSTMTW